MPELRWTLLILGALFIVGLALWELRRQRQVPRQSGMNASASTGAERVPSLEGNAKESASSDSPRVHREPTITLPELHPEPRTTPSDPPVVELDAESFSQLKTQGAASEPVLADNSEEISIGDEEISASVTVETLKIDESELPESLRADADASTPSTGFVSDADHESEAEPTPLPQPAIERRHPAASADGAPIVDWPGEESRKIVALRLVSAPAARFPGRAVRQALAAEGFVLGKFDIFHKSGPDDRAVLSAASLTKPGTFTMTTIDAQRFGGISLFAVLPGPLPAQETFDELLTTARNLNDRLQGALQDERGEPLTPVRSASIRQSLAPSGLEGLGMSGDSESADSQLRH